VLHSRKADTSSPGLTQEQLSVLRREFKALRQELGLSQADVALVSRLTQASISQFENATSLNPRRSTIAKIASVVDLWRQEQTNIVAMHPEEHQRPAHVCPKCSREVPGPAEGASHCLKCGAAFQVECSNCGHVNSPDGTFCSRCLRPLMVQADGRAQLPPTDGAKETFRKALIGSFVQWLDTTDILNQQLALYDGTVRPTPKDG